jgi:ubiquinone/menaquinone biosynthesis C-methylase UbiE
VSEHDRYRLSFDSVADVYERSRPSYAPDAVAWIAEQLPFGRVLDLGAGTGKLTRQLVALGVDVVAVEPGDEMRRVFQRVLPGIELHAGGAEAIPLPDGSVDTVTVAQAFHWFDRPAAFGEMHRVLEPGGGYALLWNVNDQEDALMKAIDAVVDTLRTGVHRHDGELEDILASPLFSAVEQRVFPHVEEIDAGAAVERVSSVSAVSAAAPELRDRTLQEVRNLVGPGTVRFPMNTTVVIAHRV